MGRILTADRHRVVTLHEEGESQANISRRTGVSRCVIQSLSARYQETERADDKPKSGRRRKLPQRDIL